MYIIRVLESALLAACRIIPLLVVAVAVKINESDDGTLLNRSNILMIASIFGSIMIHKRLSSQSPCPKPSTRSAVLITGGARGIGKDTTDYLLSQGYSVIVTVRKQNQYDEMIKTIVKAEQQESNSKVPYPILLDVTQDNQIPSAVKQLKAYLEKYDKDLVAVVNNAGINPEGEEISNANVKGETPENVLSEPSLGTRVFDTNVVGVGRVTKAFIPLLAKGADGGKKGRLINIGSYFGSVAGAVGLNHCYYEASKFALEGMTDNMRRSLKKEGVSVSLIKPGNIQTEMNAVGETSAREVAKDIEHAISSPYPKARYYPGKVKGYSAKVLCRFFEMLPTWMSDYMST